MSKPELLFANITSSCDFRPLGPGVTAGDVHFPSGDHILCVHVDGEWPAVLDGSNLSGFTTDAAVVFRVSVLGCVGVVTSDFQLVIFDFSGPTVTLVDSYRLGTKEPNDHFVVCPDGVIVVGAETTMLWSYNGSFTSKTYEFPFNYDKCAGLVAGATIVAVSENEVLLRSSDYTWMCVSIVELDRCQTPSVVVKPGLVPVFGYISE